MHDCARIHFIRSDHKSRIITYIIIVIMIIIIKYYNICFRNSCIQCIYYIIISYVRVHNNISIRSAAVRKALHTMGSLCAEVAQLKDVAATAATSIATKRLAGGEKLNALQIIIFYTLTKT